MAGLAQSLRRISALLCACFRRRARPAGDNENPEDKLAVEAMLLSRSCCG